MNMKIKLSAYLLALTVLFSCQTKPKLSITKQNWGSTDNKEVSLYTLTNANGMAVKITNLEVLLPPLWYPIRMAK